MEIDKEHVNALVEWVKERGGASLGELYGEARRRYAQHYSRLVLGKLLEEVFDELDDRAERVQRKRRR